MLMVWGLKNLLMPALLLYGSAIVTLTSRDVTMSDIGFVSTYFKITQMILEESGPSLSLIDIYGLWDVSR